MRTIAATPPCPPPTWAQRPHMQWAGRPIVSLGGPECVHRVWRCTVQRCTPRVYVRRGAGCKHPGTSACGVGETREKGLISWSHLHGAVRGRRAGHCEDGDLRRAIARGTRLACLSRSATRPCQFMGRFGQKARAQMFVSRLKSSKTKKLLSPRAKPVLQQGRMDGRDGEELEEEDDHVSYIERFKRLWRNERCAPALLPHQEELIEKLKADLEAQVRPRPARACALIAAARLCLSPS